MSVELSGQDAITQLSVGYESKHITLHSIHVNSNEVVIIGNQLSKA